MGSGQTFGVASELGLIWLVSRAHPTSRVRGVWSSLSTDPDSPLAQPVPTKKKRLLPIHSLDFEADSDDSTGCCSHPPSLSPVPAAPDSLQVSGLSCPTRLGASGQGQDPEASHPPRTRLSERLSWQRGCVGCRAVE